MTSSYTACTKETGIYSWFMELLIRLFRRETTSKEFIPVIDGLRFLAILMVVLFHADAYTKERAAGLQYSTEGLWFAKIRVMFTLWTRGSSCFLLSADLSWRSRLCGFELGLSDRKPKLRSYYLRRHNAARAAVYNFDHPYFSFAFVFPEQQISLGHLDNVFVFIAFLCSHAGFPGRVSLYKPGNVVAGDRGPILYPGAVFHLVSLQGKR